MAWRLRTDARTAREDVWKVLGRDKAGPSPTHVGNGVDGPIGIEGRHERPEVFQGYRERHAHVERGVAVNPDSPARGLETPVRLHVHGDEAVLREADPVHAVAAAANDDSLGGGGAGLDLPRPHPQV